MLDADIEDAHGRTEGATSRQRYLGRSLPPQRRPADVLGGDDAGDLYTAWDQV